MPPSTEAAPWNRFSARAGKSARGMPKTIAFESTRNIPSSTFFCRANRKPSAIERRLGRSASCAGGREGRRDRGHLAAEGGDRLADEQASKRGVAPQRLRVEREAAQPSRRPYLYGLQLEELLDFFGARGGLEQAAGAAAPGGP